MRKQSCCAGGCSRPDPPRLELFSMARTERAGLLVSAGRLASGRWCLSHCAHSWNKRTSISPVGQNNTSDMLLLQTFVTGTDFCRVVGLNSDW